MLIGSVATTCFSLDSLGLVVHDRALRGKGHG